MRHHIREATIVIPFDPYDFNSSLGIGKLADAGEELPMVAVEPAEIEVRENVAQQDQSSELDRL
jgi:hypothetical protein